MQPGKEQKTARQRALADRLDAIGWGLFFIWIGIAFLADVGIGVGLLGVSIITLVEQALRRFFRLPVEGFWVVVGLLFLLGGLWDLLQVPFPLPPVLLILVGMALLVSAIRGRHLSAKKRFRE